MRRLCQHLPAPAFWMNMVVLIACMSAPCILSAQTKRTDGVATANWQECLDDLLEAQAGSDEDDDELPEREVLYETLAQLADNPININSASLDDLLQIPLLGERQAADILSYTARYGGMKTASELFLIPSLTLQQKRLLACLIVCGETEKSATKSIPLRRMFQYAQSEVVSSAHIPFYQRAGFADGSYHGGPVKHWIRANYHFKQQMSAGITASQDAGEPFFRHPNSMGYDHYSFYFQLRNRDWLRQMVAGRYRAKLGMGLILNTNLSLGKQFLLSQSTSTMPQLKAHSSRSSTTYLQGFSTTARVTNYLDITALCSWRKIDATLDENGGAIRTLLTSGYHRTESELTRKDNAEQWLGAANLRWHKNSTSIGLSVASIHYNLPLAPVKYDKEGKVADSQVYKMVYPEGKDFFLASTDYSFYLGQLSLAGETAVDRNGHLATINKATWRVKQRLQFNAVQRYYAKDFQSPMGKSFGESGKVRNENGLYVGMNLNLSRISLTAYTDVSYFQWPTYLSFGSAMNYDNVVQVSHTAPLGTVLFRYRWRMREKDGNTRGQLIMKNEHHARLAYSKTSGIWQVKTQMDATYSRFKNESFGAMLTQTAGVKWQEGHVSAGIGYFHTDDYNSRVSTFESATLYNMSYPVFFGHGLHGYLLAQHTIWKRFTLAMKYSGTIYFDRKQIGSAKQLVNQNYLTDLDVMLKVRL